MKKRQKIRGGIVFFMFLIFPIIINYLSPVLILAGASEGIVGGSLIVFLLLFISSLFFGRGWCSWACPVGGMETSCEAFRNKKAKTGAGNIIRIIIWLVWMGFIALLFIKAGGIRGANFFLYTEEYISILNPMMVYIYLGVVFLVFIMMLIWGSRAFCKYLCWMAPFMMIGNKLRYKLKIPGLYINPLSDNCISCKRCSKGCPMDIDVMGMVAKENLENSECIMCLNCVDVCPSGALVMRK